MRKIKQNSEIVRGSKSNNSLNARISKRLDGAKIPTDIRQLAFKLLQLFEKLIKEGYVYAEFISCL